MEEINQEKKALNLILIILLSLSLLILVHHFLIQANIVASGYLVALRDLLIPPNMQHDNTIVIIKHIFLYCRYINIAALSNADVGVYCAAGVFKN